MQPAYSVFLTDIKSRIRQAQYDALRVVNQQRITLYGDIGRMIVENQETEGWGKSVVEQLSGDLQAEFPGISGFSTRNLWNMKLFHLTYRDEPISATNGCKISTLTPLMEYGDYTQVTLIVPLTKSRTIGARNPSNRCSPPPRSSIICTPNTGNSGSINKFW